MRTSYLATIAAACLIASAEAIKINEDVPSAIMDTATDGLQQEADCKAAENDAVRLAQEEAEALDAKRSAK